MLIFPKSSQARKKASDEGVSETNLQLKGQRRDNYYEDCNQHALTVDREAESKEDAGGQREDGRISRQAEHTATVVLKDART